MVIRNLILLMIFVSYGVFSQGVQSAEESKKSTHRHNIIAQLQENKTEVIVPTNVAMNRKALVIGNDSYMFVSKLTKAQEDAKAIASSLTAAGFKVTLGLDLNKKEMQEIMQTFSSQIKDGDELVLFYGGHGVQVGAINYLIPTDLNADTVGQITENSIHLQKTLSEMTGKKAKSTLVIIDASRDNPFNIEERGKLTQTSEFPIGEDALAVEKVNRTMIFSTAVGKSALDFLGKTDANKNGLFVRVFVQEIQKPRQSIDSIMKNVRSAVSELAKTAGFEQIPEIYGQKLDDFYFIK